MELGERDGLIRPQKKRQWNKSMLTFLGSLCVVGVISVIFLTSSSGNSSSSVNQLRATEAEDGPLVDDIVENIPQEITTEVFSTTRDRFAFIRELIRPRDNQSGSGNLLRTEAPTTPVIDVKISEAINVDMTTEMSSTTRDRFGFIRDLIRPRDSSASPTAETTLGKLKGVRLVSRGGREYFGFYNVPYAQPPIGELRFMPPQPAKPWDGTLDATTKGTMCVQKSRYNKNVEFEGTEDCLHVNVFTPKLPRRFRRVAFPVIVYFFGGGFMHGTANDFSAEYFMDEDVIIVIVESRVGALGFLNLGDDSASGNQGLKDQVQALRWIQENIDGFGGDPKRVVAFGTSSGAMCAHAHLLSPLSSGLVSGVMSFSGTLLSNGGKSFSRDPRSLAQGLGKMLKCDNVEDNVELLKCLRAASYEDIALGQPSTGFTPSLENGGEGAFFTDSPINIMLEGKANSVPWLLGVNSAESILDSYSLILDEMKLKNLNGDFEKEIISLMGFPPGDEMSVSVAKDIFSFYFNEFKEGVLTKDSLLRFNLTNLLGDRAHYHPSRLSGLLHTSVSNSPVYWYYLTKEANKSYADDVIQYFDPPYGVSHADEVQYVFFRERYPYIPVDSEWFEFSKMFVKYIVAFAANGSPSNPEVNVSWPAVDSTDNGTIWFNLDDKPKLVEPFTSRMQFWDQIPLDFLYVH